MKPKVQTTKGVRYSFVPSLAIIVTDKCDLQCEYCPPYGENIWRAKTECSLDVLGCILKLAKKHDIQVVRITGGEPLIVPDRTKYVLDEACRLGFEKLILNTNGTQLIKHLDWLKEYRQKFLLKVSLDTTSPKRFENISKRKGIILERIINAIRQAENEGFDIELNAVTTENNQGQVLDVLRFAEEIDVHLKIFDIFDFGGIVKAHNISTKEIKDYLEKHYQKDCGERLPGDRGIKMNKYYRESGKHVLIVNHEGPQSSSIYFSDACRMCSFFPCKTGRFQIPVRSDGALLACRLNRSEGIDINDTSCENIEREFKLKLEQFKNCFELKPSER